MQKISDTGRGFTIVELLIVIVVIAILAAITIAVYNGIQNRAYDSTAQSDLRSIGMKTTQAMLTDPLGQPPAASQAELEGVITITKSAYLLRSAISVIYCRTDDRFAYVASSKSGNVYVYVSQENRVKQGGSWGGSSAPGSCTNVNTTNDSTFSTGTNIPLLQNNTWVTWL